MHLTEARVFQPGRVLVERASERRKSVGGGGGRPWDYLTGPDDRQRLGTESGAPAPV